MFDAFGVLFARFGTNALKAANLLRAGAAMRAYGSVRLKLRLNVGEGRFLTMKSDVGKNRLSRGLAPMAHTESEMLRVCQVKHRQKIFHNMSYANRIKGAGLLGGLAQQVADAVLARKRDGAVDGPIHEACSAI